MRIAMVGAVLLAGCGRSTFLENQDPVGEGHGCFVFEPAELDFGTIEVGESKSLFVTVTNPCTGPIAAIDLQVKDTDGGDSPPANRFAGLDALLSARLVAGAELRTAVTFLPTVPGESNVIAALHGSDLLIEPAALTLTALGVGPRAVYSPDPLEFGRVLAGCEHRAQFTVSNHGNRDLVIDDAGLSRVDERLTVIGPFEDVGPLPWTLTPVDGAGAGPTLTFEAVMQTEVLGGLNERMYLDSNQYQAGYHWLPITGQVVAGASVVDPHEIPVNDPLDLVFVVDRSPSMSTSLGVIAEQSRALFSALGAQEDLDWRVSALAADDGCVLGPKAWIGVGTTMADAAAQLTVMIDADRSLAPAIERAHAGFDIAAAALSADALGPGGCNEGLLREGAGLAIVHVSDHADASELGWSGYLRAVLPLVPEPELLRVHTIGAGATTDCGTSLDGAGYQEVSAATGGLYLGVCDADLKVHPARLAADELRALDQRHHLPLSQVALPDTIDVYADGSKRPASEWFVHPTEPSIVLRDVGAHRGKTVEVRYLTPPDCEG